jgi:hypothetical protein
MDYSNIENYIGGRRRGFAPSVGIFYTEETTGGLMFMNNTMGTIITHDEVKVMIRGLVKFYRNVDPAEVEKYNNEVLEELRRQRDEHNNKVDITIKKKRIPIKGYVYFVKDDNDRVKIGKTKSPKERMGEYTKLPFKPQLELLLECKDYDMAELKFHEHFREKHIRGEWFSLTREDIEALKQGTYPQKAHKYIVCQVSV